MLMRRTLCSDVIHTMTIEYHYWQWQQGRPSHMRSWDATNFARHLPNALNFNPRHCTPTKIVTKQDDSYLHDTELPTVCGTLANHLPPAVRKAYPRLAARLDLKPNKPASAKHTAERKSGERNVAGTRLFGWLFG